MSVWESIQLFMKQTFFYRKINFLHLNTHRNASVWLLFIWKIILCKVSEFCCLFRHNNINTTSKWLFQRIIWNKVFFLLFYMLLFRVILRNFLSESKKLNYFHVIHSNYSQVLLKIAVLRIIFSKIQPIFCCVSIYFYSKNTALFFLWFFFWTSWSIFLILHWKKTSKVVVLNTPISGQM